MRAAAFLIGTVAACAPGLDVTVELDEEHPTVVHVAFDAGTPGTSTVSFGLDRTGEHTTPEQTGSGPHEHLLLGLKAGREYRWEVEHLGDDGKTRRAKGTITAGALPAELPTFETTVLDVDRAAAYGKYTMFAATNGDGGPADAEEVFFIAILDHDADWVWWHILPQGFGTVTGTPSREGNSLFWTEYDERRINPDGRIIRMTLDGEVLSETHADGAHHATVELGDGRFAYVGRVFEEMEGSNRWALTDTLVINEEGATTPGDTVFDYVVDWFEGLENFPYPPCGHVFNQLYGHRNVCELTHTNSLAFEREEQAFYLYPRTMDALLKLDVEGNLQWQIGGPWSDFTLPGGGPIQPDFRDNALWSQGHFSQVWDGGVVLFDNGVDYQPPNSSLAEYHWDEKASTIDEVWRYTPDDCYTNHLGDARKLENGHYFASWMTCNRIQEITPEGVVVFSIDTGEIGPRRIFPIDDLYRMRDAAP